MRVRSSDRDGNERAIPLSWNSWWRKLWGDRSGPGSLPPLEPTLDYPPSTTDPSTGSAGSIRVGVVSTVGHYREHNEDNFHVPGRPPIRHDGGDHLESDQSSMHLVADRWVPLIVADGMGGQLAGEKASLMAVEMLPRELNRRLGRERTDEDAVRKVVRDAVVEVNKEILAVSHIGPEFSNMGTTVVLALFGHSRVYIAGIGDSRAYRLRNGQLQRLTEDHSLADALKKAGTIGADEVANHKYKNVLYLWLGSKDAMGGPESIDALDLRRGDRFMLATDGLTGVVSDEQVAAALATGDDPQRAAQTLVGLALGNHSKDNVTVMVIHAD